MFKKLEVKKWNESKKNVRKEIIKKTLKAVTFSYLGDITYLTFGKENWIEVIFWEKNEKNKRPVENNILRVQINTTKLFLIEVTHYEFSCKR